MNEGVRITKYVIWTVLQCVSVQITKDALYIEHELLCRNGSYYSVHPVPLVCVYAGIVFSSCAGRRTLEAWSLRSYFCNETHPVTQSMLLTTRVVSYPCVGQQWCTSYIIIFRRAAFTEFCDFSRSYKWCYMSRLILLLYVYTWSAHTSLQMGIQSSPQHNVMVYGEGVVWVGFWHTSKHLNHTQSHIKVMCSPKTYGANMP